MRIRSVRLPARPRAVNEAIWELLALRQAEAPRAEGPRHLCPALAGGEGRLRAGHAASAPTRTTPPSRCRRSGQPASRGCPVSRALSVPPHPPTSGRRLRAHAGRGSDAQSTAVVAAGIRGGRSGPARARLLVPRRPSPPRRELSLQLPLRDDAGLGDRTGAAGTRPQAVSAALEVRMQRPTGTLTAANITKRLQGSSCCATSRWSCRPGAASGSSARTGRQVDAAAPDPGRPRRGRRRHRVAASPPDLTGRLPAPGARRSAGRRSATTWRAGPESPRRRRARGLRRRLVAGPEAMRPTTPPPSSGSWHSAAATSRHGREQWRRARARRSHSTAPPRRCREARQRAPALAAVLLCALRRVPPRRADERSRLRRPRPARALSSATCVARPWSSRTTATSSTERSVASSSSTSGPGRRSSPAAGATTNAARASAHERPSPRTARTRARRRVSRSAAADAGVGEARLRPGAQEEEDEGRQEGDRRAHRAARAGREAVRAVGASARSRAGPAERRRRRPARGRRRRAR